MRVILMGHDGKGYGFDVPVTSLRPEYRLPVITRLAFLVSHGAPDIMTPLATRRFRRTDRILDNAVLYEEVG